MTTGTFACDLADEDAADRITREAVLHFGPLDVLVKNAGINRRLPMLEVDAELLAEPTRQGDDHGVRPFRGARWSRA